MKVWWRKKMKIKYISAGEMLKEEERWGEKDGGKDRYETDQERSIKVTERNKGIPSFMLYQ